MKLNLFAQLVAQHVLRSKKNILMFSTALRSIIFPAKHRISSTFINKSRSITQKQLYAISSYIDDYLVFTNKISPIYNLNKTPQSPKIQTNNDHLKVTDFKAILPKIKNVATDRYCHLDRQNDNISPNFKFQKKKKKKEKKNEIKKVINTNNPGRRRHHIKIKSKYYKHKELLKAKLKQFKNDLISLQHHLNKLYRKRIIKKNK